MIKASQKRNLKMEGDDQIITTDTITNEILQLSHDELSTLESKNVTRNVKEKLVNEIGLAQTAW